VVDGRAATPSRTPATLIDIERALHVFVERACRRGRRAERLVMDVASWIYINAQTTVTVAAIVWLYLFRTPLLLRAQHDDHGDGHRPDRLHRLPDRAAALPARMGLLRLPSPTSPACAPTPSSSTRCFNPYAAVPSMHVASR